MPYEMTDRLLPPTYNPLRPTSQEKTLTMPGNRDYAHNVRQACTSPQLRNRSKYKGVFDNDLKMPSSPDSQRVSEARKEFEAQLELSRSLSADTFHNVSNETVNMAYGYGGGGGGFQDDSIVASFLRTRTEFHLDTAARRKRSPAAGFRSQVRDAQQTGG